MSLHYRNFQPKLDLLRNFASTKLTNENNSIILYYSTMIEKQEIVTILKQHKESLLSKYPIRSIGLFGSVSRNEDTSQSDIDILVEFDGNIGIRFIDLAEEFETLLKQKVDLVSKNAIKPRYYQSIKNDIIYV